MPLNQRLQFELTRARQLLWLPAIAVLLQLSGCTYQPVVPKASVPAVSSDEVLACRDLLGTSDSAVSRLDPSSISLINWNVRKKRARGWRQDFETHGKDADLVLFQEASIREEIIAEIDSSRHWSFAPGYSKRGEITGVMTMSDAEPLTQCSFAHVEPVLRTPKATSITEYALTGTDQTLVVVNVHAVNFSIGTATFETQFNEIGQVLDYHDGPIILSGDLNTWRQKLTRIIEDLATSLDLVAVDFETDHRVRVFGNALDHIYVRGLRTLTSGTEIVDTSDHNPLTAVLSL